MNTRRIYKVVGGTITGCITGLLGGIFVLAMVQATDETWLGSYFDIILYPIVGIITGVIVGLFAKPTFNAVQGGLLGCLIAVGFKGLLALSNLMNNETVVVFGVINAAIIGLAIGSGVGSIVWLIDQIQKRNSQVSTQRGDEFVEPKSQPIENQTRLRDPLPERKYRVSTSQILLNFVPIVYFVPLTILIIAIGIFFTTLFQDEGVDLLGVMVFALIGIVSVLAIIFCLYIIAAAFAYAFGTYLKVSPGGLEYLRWPYYGVRCTWDDIERLGKSRRPTGSRVYDVIYLRNSEPFGWQIMARLRRTNTNRGILLSGLQGWPTGQLADDLRHYAPHLFSNEGR
jgi:hypothetical protein